jgi:A/G-specific adenine glycosylase
MKTVLGVGEDAATCAPSPAITSHLRAELLSWYDQNRRDLPWRRTRDPYAIWVSEIMLQQTRVAAVIDRYHSFLHNFPTVAALAHASEDDVLAQWSGLGYYRRARMLHRAAKVVAFELGSTMPATATALRELPGIGAYTSAAIASIAYAEPIAVVDGNVERVLQRFAGWGSDSSQGQAKLSRQIDQLANHLLDPSRPGDFNQAMMELGATVCLPKNPLCLACPLKSQCATRGEHPTPPRARMRTQSKAYALVVRHTGNLPEVLLEQRSAAQTVMPGMWELPALLDPEVPTQHLRMSLRHAIMQVNYSVHIRSAHEQDAETLTIPSLARRWINLSDLDTLPLTGLARKVLLRAQLSQSSQAQ